MPSVSQSQRKLQFVALHWEESCTSYGKTQPVAMACSSSSPSLYFAQCTRVFLGLMPSLKVFLKSLSFSRRQVESKDIRGDNWLKLGCPLCGIHCGQSSNKTKQAVRAETSYVPSQLLWLPRFYQLCWQNRIRHCWWLRSPELCQSSQVFGQCSQALCGILGVLLCRVTSWTQWTLWVPSNPGDSMVSGTVVCWEPHRTWKMSLELWKDFMKPLKTWRLHKNTQVLWTPCEWYQCTNPNCSHSGCSNWCQLARITWAQTALNEIKTHTQSFWANSITGGLTGPALNSIWSSVVTVLLPKYNWCKTR